MDHDTAYANADFIPGAADYPERWAEAAQDWRSREAAIGRARLNHSYGPHERMAMDVFHPAGKARGLVVFVHGGYWRRFDRSYWSHFSAGAVARDWAVAMPSYPLTPEVRIRDITAAITEAVDAAAALVPGPIRLAGHSAGGHLVGRMLMPDAAPKALDRIEKVVPISPVSDLRPLLKTAMNADFRLDADEAGAESLVKQMSHNETDVTIWVGAEERPAFLDQARWLAEAWGSEHRIAPGRHHFDILDDLLDADTPLTRSLAA